MTIRRAGPADLETIVEFNVLLAVESEGVTLDRDRLRAGVSALLADESLGMYLLAEENGSAAGQLALTYEWSDWRNGMFWWLQNVYVRPQRRRRGVLRQLYGQVLHMARERGVCGVRLYVDRENRAAQRAYRRLGLDLSVYHMFEDDFVLAR